MAKRLVFVDDSSPQARASFSYKFKGGSQKSFLEDCDVAITS